MTPQLAAAQYFASINGTGGKGGPAVLDIKIKESDWDKFLAQGAKDNVPISGFPEWTQAFVPLQLIPQFVVTARILLTYLR